MLTAQQALRRSRCLEIFFPKSNLSLGKEIRLEPLAANVQGVDLGQLPTLVTLLEIEAEIEEIYCNQDFGKQKNVTLRKLRLRAANLRGSHTKAEWEHKLASYNGICPRCSNKCLKLEKDHIMPIYQGGSNALSNLQPLCKRCNTSKGPEFKAFTNSNEN